MNRNQQWILVTGLVSLVVAVAGFMLLVKPEHKKASDLKSQVATVEQATSALRTKLATLQDMNRPENKAKETAKLKSVAAQIPPTTDLASLTLQIDKAADASGVELDNLAPSPPSAASAPTGTAGGATAGKPAQSMPVALTVVGSYPNLLQFLGRLEGDPSRAAQGYLTRALLVDSFTVSYQGSKPATGTVGTGELAIGIQTRVFVSPSTAATAQ